MLTPERELWVLYIHSAWASCVARSTVMGNARATVCGMSDRYSCPAFLFVWIANSLPYIYNSLAMGQ